MIAKFRPAYTAEEALNRLKEGNARFVSGRARFPTVQKEVLSIMRQCGQPQSAARFFCRIKFADGKLQG
jgi:hypothetical protein